MNIQIATLALLAAIVAQPLQAAEGASGRLTITEVEVRAISEVTYSDLLAQAFRKGWRFSPEHIKAGYRRHLEEFKLQLINQGYTILAGEAGV